jgi:hydrogenase nickel incorporation protein HypA/HybF
MHELSIASALYESCQKAVAAHGRGRIELVRVAIGELSAVEPMQLESAWQCVIHGGPHEGARLEVQWHRARQHCFACGEDKPRALGSWLRICPDCGSPLLVEGGDELDLLQVEYETECVA